jgi:hypothetical protein
MLTLGTTAGIAAAAPSGHHHAAAPGSGLGSVDVTATATSVRYPAYSHQGEDVEAELPYTTVMFTTGGIGQSLSSILWPGDTGAHGGDVLDLLNIDTIPASVKKDLNDPEKAEAQSGVGSPTVTKTAPGVNMTAVAKPTLASATATAGGDSVPTLGKFFGSSSSSSSAQLTGPKKLIASASSAVHDVTIAKVIKIGTVTSTASAVSTGKSGSGHAATNVSGVTVAGIKVTVDGSGVHVAPGQKSPVKKALPPSLLGALPTKLPSLDTIVNKALKQSGVSLTLTKSTRKVKGALVSLDTGALVVKLGNSQYKSQDNDTSKLIILGGATLQAGTSPGFPPPAAIKPVTPLSPAGAGGGTAGTAGTPGTPGTSGTSTGAAPEVAGATGSGGQPAALSAASYQLPGGLKVWWVVLAGLVGGLVAFGLKRLPDEVLAATSSTACTLEDTP